MTWMQTRSGKRFYPLEPKEDVIDINDISHALSNLCRFAGHSSQFYSVAQHSVLVAQCLKDLGCSDACILAGLLHDATEAYLIDLPRPVKVLFPSYLILEKKLLNVIFKKYSVKVTDEEWIQVIEADNTLLITEARDLMGNPKWEGLPEPLKQKIKPWSRWKAKRDFINMFNAYTMIWTCDE